MTKDQIIKSQIYSPGLIGGEKVYFLPGENGYFIKHEGQSAYLKDNKGKFVLLPLADVIEARITYLATYYEQEKEFAIQEQIKSMHAEAIEKAQEIIKLITGHQNRRDGVKNEISFLEALPGIKEKLERETKTFFKQNPNAIEIKDDFAQLITNEDYDTLYCRLEQGAGKPLATFNFNGDLAALVNLFHAKALDNTVKELKEKGSLYLEAKIIVEKKYFPNN